MFGSRFRGSLRGNFRGVLIGIGVSAAGFYLYKKNQNKIDKYLRKTGLNISNSTVNNFAELNLEELVETKEHLEDLIAEKEMTTES